MDFSLDKYFSGDKSDYQDVSVIADFISIELDKGNAEVLNKIKEVVYNDNNSAILTRQIIQGMLMSRNEEAHRMAGELLLAARLQEGLRQAIVESMDECSREAFVYLLKIIIDNNLSRFSSIVRAFGTWTGLALDTEKPKVIEKCLNAAYSCLTDTAYLAGSYNSMDNLQIYIGMWATAFDEVEGIVPILNNLLGATEKYKKLVVLQFLYETQFPYFRHQAACKVLKEKDLEVLAMAVKNLFGDIRVYSLRYDYDSGLGKYSKMKGGCYGPLLFEQLRNIADMMPKKEIEFKGSVFPWVDVKLTTSEIIDKMILSVGLKFDSDVVDTLIAYKEKMSAESRHVFIELFLKKPVNSRQKLALLECCGDKSSQVRGAAYAIAENLHLTREDYILIENFLQYKYGDLRKNAIKLLLRQPACDIRESVGRLTESNNENKRLAAIDIVSAMDGEGKFEKIYSECQGLVSSMEGITQKEKMLASSIIRESKDDKAYDKGFGLYDRSKHANVPNITRPDGFDMKSMFSMTSGEIVDIINKFCILIHENRDFEYETASWDGTKKSVTLGGSDYLQGFEYSNRCLDNYPIADKVRDFVRANMPEHERIIELNFYLNNTHRYKYTHYLPWYNRFVEDTFNLKAVKSSLDTILKVPYFSIVERYLELLLDDIPEIKRFETGRNVSEYLYSIIPYDKHRTEYLDRSNMHYYSRGENYIVESYEVYYWLNLMGGSRCDDESFRRYFTIAYNYYRSCKYACSSTLTLEHFGRALELGIIDGNEVYLELMDRPLSPDRVFAFTNPHREAVNMLAKYKYLMEIGKIAVHTIAVIETARGELNTEVTHIASRIKKCNGADIFAAILLGSEKDTYVRGYNFISGDCTKKQMMSHLLKYCYPDEGDDANRLKELLKGKKVTDRQLIEAAMYSPQWLDIVSEYLMYEGLKSACWYFHAHVNEEFSEEKAAVVARYSPIPAQDLKDGAFDQEWFVEAYRTIGEKNFKLVYDSAKYIAGGGLHRRSQLFADATLGRLDLSQVRERVADKRNRDYLLAYGLIPVKDKEDLLDRYEYIQRYIKESKQFGAQRQASETRSGNIALLNLARNAGYNDVNRLTWNMETAKVDSIRGYLSPYNVEDVEVYIGIDEHGRADVVCRKDGKVLKDIPSKLKKHGYIQDIKAVKKSLKGQYIRARESFEAAMEKGDVFEAGELQGLCANPVLAPIIKNLVFISDGRTGYFNDKSLIDYNGEIFSLNDGDKLVIAHPVQLYECGEWSNYQRNIFDKKLVQPFKQVFRELYMPNADELKELTVSRRYAGHQIQPKKAVALLKTRGWLASSEGCGHGCQYRPCGWSRP